METAKKKKTKHKQKHKKLEWKDIIMFSHILILIIIVVKLLKKR